MSDQGSERARARTKKSHLSRRALLSAAAAAPMVAAVAVCAESADTDLAALFRRWADAQTRVYDLASWADDETYVAAHREADGLIEEIFAHPSRDATAWAIKTYLRMHVMYGPTLEGPLDIALSDESGDAMLMKIDQAMLTAVTPYVAGVVG